MFELPDEPISREVHALALTSLYSSLVREQQSAIFAEQWPIQGPEAPLARARQRSVRIAGLQLALAYHQRCYDACRSVDADVGLPRRSLA